LGIKAYERFEAAEPEESVSVPTDLPDVWIDPREMSEAEARSPAWAVNAHNCEVIDKDVRYIPEAALRQWAIKPHRIPYEPIVCRLCLTGWGHDGPEQHAPDCLLSRYPL
jgi:hypothetical protein